ncbi:titin homolog [Sander lucioperca]|uniref:titin homolog n=1 Tax=Sander lucioperca TaxID=283035 RepID=UPI0016534D1F|nr:titin homolog [Sander lucioperca]
MHLMMQELNNTNEQISPVEELAQNDVQKVPEIRLQEDDVTNECDPKDQQDKNTVTTDLPKTSPRDRRSVSPLSFLREDFSHFKEELLKVFRDKDTDQSSEAARMHDPLKVDLAFKVDVASVFKSTDPKSSQSAEKTNNRLSFLNFKDHVSNAFRLGPSKVPDSSAAFKIKASSMEPDSSNAFKIKASSKERDNEGVTAEEDSSNAFKIKASSMEPDSSNAFKIKASSKERDNEGVTAEEDSSNAFKIKASSKERDNEGVTAKEDSSNAFKIKASSKERDNEGVTAKEDSSNAFKIKASSKEPDSSIAFKIKASSMERDNEGVTAKEDSSNAFKIKAFSKERDNKGVTAKEDSSNAFKIKVSSDVFTLNPSKERDNKGVTAEEDSSNAFKIKAERTDGPFLLSLFRKTSQKVESGAEDKKIISETSEQTKEEIDASFKGNVLKQNEETVDAEKINDNLKDGMKEMEVAETTSVSETQHEETINRLSFLNFKDVSNVFRLGPSKERDSSNAFKIKASSKERDHKGVTAEEVSSNAFKIKASSKERDHKGVTAEEVSSNAFKIKASSMEPDSSNAFKIKASSKERDNEGVTAKEDLSNAFKIKASSDVFTLNPSKERDNKGVTAEEDSSNAFKIKAERTDGPFLLSLFRKTSQKVESGAEDKKIISETSEQTKEEIDASFKGNVLKQNEETVDAEKINDNLKDGMKEMEVAETTSVSETQHEETINRLSFLNFKDVSNVFRLGPSKERDHKGVTAKEDSSNTFKIKAERTEEPFVLSLFRKTPQKVESSAENESIISEISQFAGFKGNVSEQNEETVDAEKINDNLKDGMNEVEVNEITSLSETQHREEMIPTSQAVACYLTFDPNTANSELRLSDSNRTVTRAWTELWPPEHPDRFQRCPQVLCREGLLDSAYWEAEWSGGADIGIAYNDIYRDGDAARCLLGHNERSWSLECSEGSYTPCHANRRFRAAAPRPFARRVGVHLDWSAGALSFYCVSQDAMVHLHTFRDNFTEPLYPAFWVWAYDGSVSLSQVELDWERLLQ